MMQNILVGIMTIVAVGAGIFGWWIENGGAKKNNLKEEDAQKKEKEKEI